MKRNRGQRLVFRLNGNAFFGFQCLMQAVGKTPPFHHATGKFINDNDLSGLARAAHNIIAVFLKQNMGAQSVGDMMHKADILNVVNRAALLQKAVFDQQLFHMLIAVISQIDGFGFLVQLIIFRRQERQHFINADIEVGAVFKRAGDNQRRARLINQNTVNLIDNGEAVAALAHFCARIFHIVAQIIKAQLIIGGIGDVGRISDFTRLIIHIMHNATDT